MESFNTTSSFFSKDTCTIDGAEVRLMGIGPVLERCASKHFSNIDIGASEAKLEKRWRECNMGCHVPSYRIRQGRPATIDDINEIHPMLGTVAEKFTGTVDSVEHIGNGISRTIETVKDYDRISTENGLVVHLLETILKQTFSLSLTAVNNPFTSLFIQILDAYFSAIPAEIIFELAASGKLKLGPIDINLVIAAVQSGLTKAQPTTVNLDNIKQLGAYLSSHPEMIRKMVNKLGEKVEEKIKKKISEEIVKCISSIISIEISKKVAKTFARSAWYKSIMEFKHGAHSKHLVEVLIQLLELQGELEHASHSSHELFAKCPKLWHGLRNSHGLDLIYYAVEGFMSEYVDRISLAEHNREMFGLMVMAILKPPGTATDLFFPFKLAV